MVVRPIARQDLQQPLISVQGVVQEFTRQGQAMRALDQVNLTLQKGEFVSLLGPSGCGKTTLLRIIGGLTAPSEGKILFHGSPVEGPAKGMAMVFQDFALLPWRTALGNVAFGLEAAGIPKEERLKRAERALAMVDLTEFAHSFPNQMSGGMKQRIGLARALCTNPEVLLMDEPMGALDPQIREIMQVELMKIWEQDRKTVIFVTHSVEEAIFLSDRVVVMTYRPGRIKEDVHIDLPRPRWTPHHDVRNTPQFREYREYLWSLLRPEVRLTRS